MIVDRGQLSQGFPYHSFSQQLSSFNTFPLPDVMTFCSMLLCRNHRRSKCTALDSTGGIFLHTKPPMFRHSPIQIDIGGIFAHIASPSKWGKNRVEFVTLTSPKKSWETTRTVILVTDGVGESDLGMVTVFCHPDQARIRGL